MDAEVVVVRALRGLGDILCAVPSLRHIRQAMPDATVRFLGVDEVRPLLARFSDYIDGFVPFPGYPGIPEQPASAGRLSALPASPDLVVQMHGDGSVSNGFAASMHPRALAAHGAVIAEKTCAVATRPYDRTSHEVERCLRVTDDGLRLLGVQPRPATTELEFRIAEHEHAEAEALLAEAGLDAGAFALLHPGSHLPDRRWPAAHFTALGRRLAAEGSRVAITGTPGEEAVTAQIAEAIGAAACDLTGRLTLGGLAALLTRAGVLVVNDTGVSHLAAAVKARSVVVFMASDPHRWAPLDGERHRAVVRFAPPGHKPNAVSPEGRRLSVPSVTDVIAAVHEMSAN